MTMEAVRDPMGFKCPVCRAYFQTELDMDLHMRNKHEMEYDGSAGDNN